jgi:hypothetical protein
MAPVEFDEEEASLEAKPIMDGSGADSKPILQQTFSLMGNQGTVSNFLDGSGADERVYDHPKLPAVYDHPKLPSRKSRISAALWKHLSKTSSKPRAPSCPSFRLLKRKPASKIAPAPNTEGADFPQTTSIVPSSQDNTTSIVPFSQDNTEKALEIENVPTVAGMPVDVDHPFSDATGGTPVGNAKAKAIDQDAVVELVELS